jgi:hypothetical protein
MTKFDHFHGYFLTYLPNCTIAKSSDFGALWPGFGNPGRAEGVQHLVDHYINQSDLTDFS